MCALAGLGLACAKPKSFVVLKLESGTSISDITDVGVLVQQGTMMKMLTYPAPSVTIDDMNPTDLSVSFTGGQSGDVTFQVTLVDLHGCILGKGQATGVIKGGNVTEVVVPMTLQGGCSHGDAGTDGQGMTLPGCAPAAPNCAATDTCQVDCTAASGPVAECTPGGSGGPGTPCATNKDCEPGAQCFDYTNAGCAALPSGKPVKLCLRFCDDDTVCGAATTTSSDGGASDAGAGDGGKSDAAATGGAAVGTRSLCLGPVQCGQIVTSYHTCTFGCDPREAAVSAKTSGCPQGLSCLVVGDGDQVDCACAEKTRTGTDGAPCTGSAQCAPGYICNLMGTVRACRAVCRCDSDGTSCTHPNDCTAAGRACSPLTNDVTFGVCL